MCGLEHTTAGMELASRPRAVVLAQYSLAEPPLACLAIGARPPPARHLGALRACRRRASASDAAWPPRVCQSTVAAARGAAQPAAARAQVTLAGHRGAVTALRYNRSGALLASGAQDTDAIVWDVVAEAGLFRLRAHSGQVTDLVPPRLGPCASTAPIARMSPLHAAGDACMPGTLLRRQHGPPGALQ